MSEQKLHRIYLIINTELQWYAAMREARAWFGNNWKSQGKVRKKLSLCRPALGNSIKIWFDVPDLRWSTWIATKLAIQVSLDSKEKYGK
jgi:hypothetical protein